MSAGAPRIDWATSEVRDGALSVALAGERPKHWRRHMVAVLEVLDIGSGGWGRVRVRKDRLEVADIHEGSEERLRQMLDGAVGQANADTDAVTDADSTAGEEEDPDEARERLDRRMTDVFRGFARQEHRREAAPTGV